MYVTLIRPDLSYIVHILSQLVDKPAQIHLDATFKVLRYLKGALGQGLFLSDQSEPKLTAYSNSDWANCSETRRFFYRFLYISEEFSNHLEV